MKDIMQGLILCCLSLNNLIGQLAVQDFVGNEETTFSIVSTNYWQADNAFSKFRKSLIRIENFKYKLEDFNSEDVLKLINGFEDETRDWSCNLILYQLANRDALHLFSLSVLYVDVQTGLVKSEKELIQLWRDFYKKEDEKYWDSWLHIKYGISRI